MIADDDVTVVETSKAEAETMGALAFFGDKYGERVRVVRAGPHSTEFCGGTHVPALGMIGPVTILSESSIGSNTRRIFAVTGAGSLALLAERNRALEEASQLLRVDTDNVIEALQKLIDRQRQGEKEVQRLRGQSLQADAAELAGTASGGVVVARCDGRTPDELRDLAQATLQRDSLRAVVLGGSPDGAKATLAVATSGDPHAGNLVKELAALVGGGGGGSPEAAVAGGRDPGKIDEALAEARRRFSAA